MLTPSPGPSPYNTPLTMGQGQACKSFQASEHGQKYEIRGIRTGPSGRSAEIVSVWIILSGENVPRFVTAYPGAE